MLKNDQARKIRLDIDGVQIPNLVQFGAIERNQVTVEVPSINKLRTIITGVDTIPLIDAGFKNTRNSDTKQFIIDWYTKNQVKNVVVVETDGAGNEIDRINLLKCECSKYAIPEYLGESPSYYRIDITIAPEDIEEIL